MRKLSMEELERLSTASYKSINKVPVVVILENIRSGLNVGSIFRTSDAFLVEAIHLCGYTPKPPHRDVLKSALGATESVEWEEYETIVDSLQHLKGNGYKLYAVEQVDTSIYLPDFTPGKEDKIALIFGNEVYGVSDEALSLVDACIEIPQWGTKHSLNISVCAGIVIWDIIQKIKLQ